MSKEVTRYKLKERMADYMKLHKLRPFAFAKVLGIVPPQSFLYWYENENKNLSLEISEKFEDLEWSNE